MISFKNLTAQLLEVDKIKRIRRVDPDHKVLDKDFETSKEANREYSKVLSSIK